MPRTRTALVIAILMAAAAAGAMLARPGKTAANGRPAVSLENMVPRQFGSWRESPQVQLQVVNPQTQQMLDQLYSEILTRVYVSDSGYRVMLSLAYGSDQRGAMQAHMPEVCYPAQGFSLARNEPGVLATEFGSIPVRRLYAVIGTRHEPITYWFTVGDRAVQGRAQKRIVELTFGLTGRIPDGMLFRVSSIDSDLSRAYRMQAEFVDELLRSATPPARKRLSGLGES